MLQLLWKEEEVLFLAIHLYAAAYVTVNIIVNIVGACMGMGNGEDEARYARMCLLILNIATIVLRKLIQHYHPNQELGDILDDDGNKHTLFKLRYKRCCCCAHTNSNCPLNKLQWDLLYETVPTALRHIQTTVCKCLYGARHTININEMDITLCSLLIKNICKSVPQRQLLYIDDIRKVRNDISHAKSPTLDEHSFNRAWTSIQTALENLAVTISKEFKDDIISKIKEVEERLMNTDELKALGQLIKNVYNTEELANNIKKLECEQQLLQDKELQNSAKIQCLKHRLMLAEKNIDGHQKTLECIKKGKMKELKQIRSRLRCIEIQQSIVQCRHEALEERVYRLEMQLCHVLDLTEQEHRDEDIVPEAEARYGKICLLVYDTCPTVLKEVVHQCLTANEYTSIEHFLNIYKPRFLQVENLDSSIFIQNLDWNTMYEEIPANCPHLKSEQCLCRYKAKAGASLRFIHIDHILRIFCDHEAVTRLDEIHKVRRDLVHNDKASLDHLTYINMLHSVEQGLLHLSQLVSHSHVDNAAKLIKESQEHKLYSGQIQSLGQITTGDRIREKLTADIVQTIVDQSSITTEIMTLDGDIQRIEGEHQENRRSNDTVIQLMSCGMQDIITQWVNHGFIDSNAIQNGHTPLYYAARSGSVILVKYFIANGYDVNTRLANGQTISHIASREGNFDLLEYMVENFGNVLKKTDNDGFTPFHSAGVSGSVEIVEYLIFKGCDVTSKTTSGDTILHIACLWGKVELGKYLVAKQKSLLILTNNDGYTPFHLAGKSGSVETIEFLLSEGCKLNMKTESGLTVTHIACKEENFELLKYMVDNRSCLLQETDNDGYTPLHFAGTSGSVAAVNYLLDKGCDIDSSSRNDETIMHIACESGNFTLVKYFVESHRNTFKKCDKAGFTPFHRIGKSGSVEILQYLLSNNFDVHRKTSAGQTVAHIACECGKFELVKFLMENYDYMFKQKDISGKTPFLCAGKSGSVEIVEYLLSKGCDIYSKDNYHQTITHIASEAGKYALVKYLVVNNGDVFQKSKHKGYTPFHCAGVSGSVETARFLISKGYDVNTRTNKGENIAHIACENGNTNLVEFLMEYFGDIFKQINNYGYLPFHYAGKSGVVDVVSFLISKGSDVYAKTSVGETITHIACEYGQEKLTKHLIEHDNFVMDLKDIYGLTPFHCAGISGSVDIVKFFLFKGYKVNTTTIDNYTIAHIACEYKNHALITYLAEHHSHLFEITDKLGRLPIHYAGISGSVKDVKYLLSIGSNIYSKTAYGHLIIHYACRWGNINLVKYLVKHFDGILKETDNAGCSPFIYAGIAGSVELVEYLISKDCDVYEKTKDGETITHLACEGGELELVQYLVDNYDGVLFQADNLGYTPLHSAGISGSIDTMQFVLSKGCDIHCKTAYGDTVTHIACGFAKFELVKYLVEYYDDVLNQTNRDGDTPFPSSYQPGYLAFVQFLVSKGFRFCTDKRLGMVSPR